jgi:hypothetical protein
VLSGSHILVDIRDYVSAILAYNDDMEDDDEDLELSITDLVERTRLDDSLASTDDDDHEELLMHPRPLVGAGGLPLASANRDRDRLHRRRVISEESESESESEGEKRESGGGAGATRIVELPDLVDDNVFESAPPAPSPVGGRSGLVDYYQGLDGELSEEELLQMALRESMLEQQLRDGGGAITGIALTAATDDELRADEELARYVHFLSVRCVRRACGVCGVCDACGVCGARNAWNVRTVQAHMAAVVRALHDELNRSMSDERLARRLAQELQREGALHTHTTHTHTIPRHLAVDRVSRWFMCVCGVCGGTRTGNVAPVDDTTAILTTLSERTRELREQTEAARARLADATDGGRRHRERQRQRQQQLADAAVAAAAAGPAPTSYFRRNFSPVFSTIAPADVAAASTGGGGDGERTSHRHRHRHRHGRYATHDTTNDTTHGTTHGKKFMVLLGVLAFGTTLTPMTTTSIPTR